MKTEIKPITAESLAEAKQIIEEGGVVAMPTETVYGLGGDACNDEAVQRIFTVKGRPNDNPLIAHVHTEYDLSKIIDFDPPYAKKLREAFLPGPLTLVYPSTGKVSPYVSCGLNTLAVRIPAHEGAQAFLKAVDIPIVGDQVYRLSSRIWLKCIPESYSRSLLPKRRCFMGGRSFPELRRHHYMGFL